MCVYSIKLSIVKMCLDSLFIICWDCWVQTWSRKWEVHACLGFLVGLRSLTRSFAFPCFVHRRWMRTGSAATRLFTTPPRGCWNRTRRYPGQSRTTGKCCVDSLRGFSGVVHLLLLIWAVVPNTPVSFYGVWRSLGQKDQSGVVQGPVEPSRRSWVHYSSGPGGSR